MPLPRSLRNQTLIAKPDYTRALLFDDGSRRSGPANVSPPKQPKDIKEIIINTISDASTKNISQVGMRLMKFCARWDLQRIADQAAQFSEPLQARYNI